MIDYIEMKKRVTIIGGGNMGGAIARGIVMSGSFPEWEVTVVNRREEVTRTFSGISEKLKAVTLDYSSVADSDIVIVAVKPKDVKELLGNISPMIETHKVLISVAADVSLEKLCKYSGGKCSVYCAIPNTAIEVMESMTYISTLGGSEEENELVKGLFNALGKAEIIPEKDMNAAMVLCSCGIAYAFRYIRASIEGGVEIGMKPDAAMEGIIQTLKGAAALLESKKSHPEVEIDKVTTAGGITIKGLNEMEHNGFSSAVIKGLKASAER